MIRSCVEHIQFANEVKKVRHYQIKTIRSAFPSSFTKLHRTCVGVKIAANRSMRVLVSECEAVDYVRTTCWYDCVETSKINNPLNFLRPGFQDKTTCHQAIKIHFVPLPHNQ